MSDKKREEAAVETLLQYMHKNYISLRDEDMKSYVDHFRKVLEELVDCMKKEDVLFRHIYSRICGAGSYYDGLKVSKPEEFDMDVVIRLPVNYKEIVIVNDKVPPAFTKIQITRAMDLLRQHPKWTEAYRFMDSWRDKDGFLLQSEFRQWIEGVVNKALNTLKQKESNCYELVVKEPDSSGKETKYLVSLTKSGPAMTFHVTIPPDNVELDVDFVPVIEFTDPQWPPKHVRKLPTDMMKKSWFIVPKPKKTSGTGNPDGTIWRLAFHEQEREMINDKGCLKPVCRLLKKFRDETRMNIASYYIKTLFLWELDSKKEPDFWKKKQGQVYIYMLEKLEENLKKGEILYYWDKRYNLLEGMSGVHKNNLLGRLKNIIADIKKNVADKPQIIAKTLLSEKEFEALEQNFCKAAVLTPVIQATAPSPPNNAKEKKSESKIQPKAATPCSTCINMASKLDKILDVLDTLQSKVVKLENAVERLREENIQLKDELILARKKFNLNTPRALDLSTAFCNVQQESENIFTSNSVQHAARLQIP